MTRRARRLSLIGAALCVFGVAVGLVLFALRDNIVFSYSPTEIEARHVAPGVRLRIGGLVEQGAWQGGQGRAVTFVVTDGQGDLPVTYTGILPDPLRRGPGVVPGGRLDHGATCRAHD